MPDPKNPVPGSIPVDLMRPEDTTTRLAVSAFNGTADQALGHVRDYAVVVARQMIGTTEEGGNNRGPAIESMLVDAGGKPGMPWCLAFVQRCYQRGFAMCATASVLPQGLHVGHFAQRCLRALPSACSNRPTVGAIALHYPDGYDAPGHCGIVTGIHGAISLSTIEGNTNEAGGRDSTTGDGVWPKIRPLGYWTLFVDIGFLNAPGVA